MKRIVLKLTVAIATFLIGIVGAAIWFFIGFSSVATESVRVVTNDETRVSIPITSTPVIQDSTGAKPVKKADKLKIDELIASLGRGTIDTKQKYEQLLVKEQLLFKFVEKDSARRSYAAGKLIANIKQTCQANEKYIQSDFVRVQSASNILAELEVTEALDTLIDCSNRRSPVGGLSSHNWGTAPAIIKYREKAMPALIEKMGSKEVDPDVKERIYIMWREIVEQIKRNRSN